MRYPQAPGPAAGYNVECEFAGEDLKAGSTMRHRHATLFGETDVSYADITVGLVHAVHTGGKIPQGVIDGLLAGAHDVLNPHVGDRVFRPFR